MGLALITFLNTQKITANTLIMQTLKIQFYKKQSNPVLLCQVPNYKTPTNTPAIRNFPEKLISNVFLGPGFGSDLIHYLSMFFEQPSKMQTNDSVSKHSLSLTQEDRQWLQAFNDHIQKDLQNLKVPDLARAFAMSESTLLRQVKRLTGMTPATYLRNKRLQRAQYLLESDEQHSIAKIATKVGYKDARAFSRSFKKRFGSYPSEVLRDNQKEK